MNEHNKHVKYIIHEPTVETKIQIALSANINQMLDNILHWLLVLKIGSYRSSWPLQNKVLQSVTLSLISKALKDVQISSGH